LETAVSCFLAKDPLAACLGTAVGCLFELKIDHADMCYMLLLNVGETLSEVTANAVPSSPILDILMKEALNSSEKSVLTRATLHKIAEDAILHSHRRENLKSYVALTGWTL
jgi:hypothetical protein